MEQVDAHVAQHIGGIDAIAQSGKVDNPGLSLIFTAAIPILAIVRGLLFFKPTWQKVIDALMAGMQTFITSTTAAANHIPVIGGKQPAPAAAPAEKAADAPIASTEGKTEMIAPE